MATSNRTRDIDRKTNPFFQKLFCEVSSSDNRERQWKHAILHEGEGDNRLRFPLYERLFTINMHSQELIDLLEDTAQRFGFLDGETVRFQSMIHYVRAGISQQIVDFMNGVEQTECWLFERLLQDQEIECSDSDD